LFLSLVSANFLLAPYFRCLVAICYFILPYNKDLLKDKNQDKATYTKTVLPFLPACTLSGLSIRIIVIYADTGGERYVITEPMLPL
jgi:hypothetical protein